MDTENPVIKLCVLGTEAEFAGKLDEAQRLYQEAWETAQDDYEACIAAHYMARHQPTPQGKFSWNQEALRRAEVASDGRVQPFFPSLYLSMGQSYELLGNADEAQHYYDRAAELGFPHQAD